MACERLGRPARAQRPVRLAAGQQPGVEAGRAQALEGRGPREGRHLADGPQPQVVERAHQVRRERQPGDRQRRQEGRHLVRADHQRAAVGRLAGRLQGGEAGRGGPHAPAGAHRQRRARPAQDALGPAVQPAQAVGLEAGVAELAGLHPGAHRLQAQDHPLGRLGRRRGVGGHQVEPGAAGQRLAHPQPGPHALGLGGRGAEPHDLGRARGRAERHRAVHRPAGREQRDQQREAGDVSGDDHTNTCSHTGRRYGCGVRGPAAMGTWALDRAAGAGPATGHVAGLAGVGVVSALVALPGDRIDALSMGVCYQLLVLVVSGAFGIRAGLSTSLASVVAFNLFFIPPTGSLTVGDEENWISLVVFAATAVVTSRLAAGARRQSRESEARRRDADLLAELAETILGEMGPSEPGPAVEAAAARALGVSRCAVVLAPSPDHRPAPTGLRPAPEGFTVPLVVAGRAIGLLEVGPALPRAEPRWARPGLATAVAGLAAVAVERSRLIRAALEAESLRRSDELKTALLHGVSHEFRTPITAIRTAAHALRERPGAGADPLLAVMAEETARLDRLVANLLDLSRLEAGALVARMDWCAPAEIAAGALEEAAPFLDGRSVELDVPLDLPLVRADAVLAERILVNLLHNAARHGAGPVRVAGRVAGDAVELAVADRGPGVDPAVAARLFSPFAPGGVTGGTGIGLALSRGLAEAQGASLVHAADPGGARFVLAFPLVAAPEVVG